MSRYLFRWLRYYALFKPLSRLPLSLAYQAASAIGRWDYRHQADARAALAQGLRQVYSQRETSAATLERWLQRYFVMLARESMDVFVMPRLTPTSATALLRLQPGSLDVLRQARQSGRGVIIAMGHYSRVNMLLLALGLAGETLGMLTMVIDARNPDLNPLERRYLKNKIGVLLHFIRGRWVTLGDDMRVLYRALADGETMVLLLDAHTPGRHQKKLKLPFLGGELAVSRGIVRLAERTGAQVVYGVPKEQDWAIEVELRPLPTEPYQALAAAARELENDVRAAPWAWWHWPILDAIWNPGLSTRS